MDFEIIYCTECSSNTKHVDGECCVCNPEYRMSCTEELDFSDNLYDRYE